MGVKSGYYDEWCISSNPLSSATDREHTITSTAKLIQELTGTTWAATASTLCTSALVLVTQLQNTAPKCHR